MSFFPNLPVLEHLLKQFRCQPLNNWHLVSVQHLMRSTGSMFKYLIELGFSPDHIWTLSKIYSLNHRTAEELNNLGINIINPTLSFPLGQYAQFLKSDVESMWQTAMKSFNEGDKIIVLDDGGFCLANIPQDVKEKYLVYGIEQTSSGIRMKENFDSIPIINVAESAAKLLIEPAIVSEAVQLKLGGQIRSLGPKKIGLIGYGTIGRAVHKELGRDYEVMVFDRSRKLPLSGEIQTTDDLNILYNCCDLIIGVTGNDISSPEWYWNAKGDKNFISISSGDVEFNGLLRLINEKHKEEIKSPLDDILIKVPNGYQLRILRGGLVANFTGEPDSSPSEIIQFTRGLLLSAVIQIIQSTEYLRKPGSYMLSPKLQKSVFEKWISINPDRINDYSLEILGTFDSIELITQHSNGKILKHY